MAKSSVSYKQAVIALSTFMDHHKYKINAFDGSLILAYMFDVPKEKALDDLIAYRR